MLEEYSRPGFYDRLHAVGEYFYRRFQEIIQRSGVPVRLQYVGPRFGMYFGIRDEVTNYRQAALKDRALEHAFIAGCYRRGVYFAVSPHHGFSAAHTEADMDRVLEAIAGAMEDVQATLARALRTKDHGRQMREKEKRGFRERSLAPTAVSFPACHFSVTPSFCQLFL